MNRPLVMTVLGEDRPGLVELVARLVSDHHGNWLESRMSHLGGQFAGILRVEVPAAKEEDLIHDLQALSRQGLTVVVHRDAPTATPAPTRLALLEIVGQDRPGIVRQISQTLAAHHANVEELNTECASAPMSGETLFTARAHLRLPDEPGRMAALQKALETIAADLMVECSLDPVEDSISS